MDDKKITCYKILLKRVTQVDLEVRIMIRNSESFFFFSRFLKLPIFALLYNIFQFNFIAVFL